MARSALFKYRLPVASLLLAAAAAGCDNDQSRADKKVAKQLEDASFKADGKLNDPLFAADGKLRDTRSPKTIKDYNDITGMTDMSEYNNALDAAANKEPAVGPLEQIQAKTLLAHDELRAAMEKAAEAARTSAMIDRLSLQVLQMSTQIRNNSAEIDRLKLSDPKVVAAALAKISEHTTGSGGSETWLTTPSGTLSSKAAIDKQIAAVKSKIDDIQSGIRGDEKLEADAKEEENKYQSQAETVQGPKMVDLITQSDQARQKASDLSTQIDRSKAKLNRAMQDLDLLTAQREVIESTKNNPDGTEKNDAEKDYKKIGDGLQDTWKAAQDDMAKLKAKSQSLLGNDSDAAPDPADEIKTENGGDSIASKMALIQKLAAKNKKLRSEAQGHFISAVKFYSDAYAQANKLKSDLASQINANTGKPNVDAWEAEQDAIAPLNYLLYRGNADLDLATFLARGAEEDLSIKKLAATVNKISTDAGLTQPTALNGIEEPNPKAVTLEALKHFTTANADLKQVYEAQGLSRKVAAHSMSMYAQYEWYLFDLNSGAEDETAAKLHLQLATDAVKSMGNNDHVYFSKLPPELAEVAPAAPAAPGGPGAPAAPAAAPAAGGDAPAPTGFGTPDFVPTMATVAGTFVFAGPDPKHPERSINASLVLSSDGTYTDTADITMKGPPPLAVHGVATGTFTIDPAGIIKMKMATFNGNPPPATMTEKDLNESRKLTDGGKTLIDTDTGDDAAPPFTRKE